MAPNTQLMDTDTPVAPAPVTLSRADYDAMAQRIQDLETQLNNLPPGPSNIDRSHEQRNDDHHSLSSSFKPIRPPHYNGVKSHTVVENWIAAADSYFILTRAEPEQIYHCLNTILTDTAAIWFRYRYRATPPQTISWPTVREEIRSYFIPPNKDRRLLDQWAELRQTTTVADYVAKFYELGMQVPEMSRGLLLDKFLRGLKHKTRMELELKDPKSLEEAIRLADRYDSIVFTKGANWNKKYYGESTPEYEPGGEPMLIDALHTKNPKSKSPEKPSKGQPVLHKLTDEERNRLRSLGACFKCRKTGHMARECPTNAKNSKDQ